MEEIEKVLSRFKPIIKATIEKWVPRGEEGEEQRGEKGEEKRGEKDGERGEKAGEQEGGVTHSYLTELSGGVTTNYLTELSGGVTHSYLTELSGGVRYREGHSIPAFIHAVTGPMYDMLDRGGKAWRPVLLLLIAEALGKAVDEVLDLTVICELIHNGTLMIDDIEDNSTHRRGKPCSHIIYGTDIAINAGNLMYYLPMLVLKKKKGILPDSVLVKLYELYITEMTNLHIGQGYDIWWHSGKSNEVITIENYLQMCAFKTGALAKMSGVIAAYICGVNDETARTIGNFCETIGIAFQIQDDILCVVGEQFGEGKGGIGEDIREGKRTLMVIHSFQYASPANAERLKAILNKHTTDPNEVKEAIDILQTSGSIDYARAYAKKLVEEAWREVDGVLVEGSAKKSLQAFANFLIERSVKTASV